MVGNLLTIFGGLASNILTFGFIAPYLWSAKDSTMVLIGITVVIVQLFCDLIWGKKFVTAVKEVYEHYVG